MSKISKINDERIKLSVKSSNYHIASSFASTDDSIGLFLLANNSNLYNWNNPNTGTIIGAQLIHKNTDYEHHEPYIAIKKDNVVEKLATFNKNQITLTGNIIPSSNLVYSLGSHTQRWNDLYLAGNTIELGQISLSVSERKALALSNDIENIPPPFFEGGGLRVTASNGDYAVTAFDEEGKYVTKTYYADGGSKPMDYIIYDNIDVKNKADIRNLQVSSNTVLENLSVVNTLYNRETINIQHGNNKHNIIETYNYPLKDEPYIEVISDNNLTIGNNTDQISEEIIGKYFSFNRDLLTWDNVTSNNHVLEVFHLRTKQYFKVKTWATREPHFKGGNYAGRRNDGEHNPGDFHIGDRMYQYDPRIEADFFIFDKNAKLGLNKQPTSRLDVNGDAYIQDSMTINEDLFVNRNQIIEGNEVVIGNVSVHGEQYIEENLYIKKDTITNNLKVDNDLEINNNLFINNDVYIDNNLKTENAIVNNNLNVNNKAYIKDISINNTAIIENNLFVNKKAYIEDIEINNNININNDLSTYNAQINNNLTINNNLDIDNNLFVNNQANIKTLNVVNNANIDNNLFTKNAYVNNNLDVQNNLNINNDLQVNNKAFIKELDVNKNIKTNS